MPYGWDQNLPSGNDYALPPHLYQQPQNEQQTQYSRPQPVAGQQQQFQQSSQTGYVRSHTQYSTPYNQSPQVIYQFQSPPVQYQQQPYRSPQTQYSPDPLQNWQIPPQAREQALQQRQAHHHQNSQQRRPSGQQPQVSRQQSTRQSFPASDWNQIPASPYTPVHSNTASVTRNHHLPPQQHAQHQAQQVSSQPRPASSQFQSSRQAPQHYKQQPQQSRPHPQPSPLVRTTVNPQDVQRRVAHVQIPVQRPPQRPDELPMAQSPKRRRSNEGHAVPVDYRSQAKPQSSRPASAQRPKPVSSASLPLTEVTPSQMHSAPTNSSIIDNQAALLALSDEYISAAYSMGASLSPAEVDEAQLDHYHSLLATGMGCLETVLKNYRISDARKEARIRLRFAGLLFEETDNDIEAEECLSKGISSCERSRLPDLKYTMHHLLARVWFKGGKTKAAMKAVEKLIVEVEKLNLIHWVYAFRFLRVSFGLQVPTHPGETAIMVKHLTAIVDTAVLNYNNVSVQIVAATLSAMVHLRSHLPDSVDSAQRDLAAARTHQLSPEIESLPQVRALLDCLDLACSLVQGHPEQANAKMQVMQGNLDTASRQESWRNEHNWSMPLGRVASASPDLEADSHGIFRLSSNGEGALNFKWLAQSQIYATGFLLSGLSVMHTNATNELKAEQFLSEGVKLSKQTLTAVPQSEASASAQASHQYSMLVTMRLYLVFAFCGRSAWDSGLNGIAAIRRELLKWKFTIDDSTAALITYLEAVCKHGLADLGAALELYRSPELALESAIEVKPSTGTVDPLKILAGLNSILILRTSSATIETADRLLARLEPHCTMRMNCNGNEYGNRAMEAAFNILKATSSSQTAADGMIIKTKQYLHSAVHGAKVTLNNQLLCVVMNIMTTLFFSNIVGEQAEKSAKAGRSLAKKSKDKLWTAVADRMYADTLVRCGKSADAQQVRMEGEHTMQQIPDALKAVFQEGNMNGNGV